MTARLLLPVLLIAGAAAFVFSAEDAHAHPVTATSSHGGVFLHPRVHVGVGVTVPVRPRRVYRRHHYREVVEYVGGYYETRTKEVRVPGEQIGWDMHGKPMFGPDRVEVREYKVWVPRRRIVRQVRVETRRVHRRHYARPRGYVTVGGGVRVR